MISLIVALDKNGVIGKGGTLPWHLPADLKRFKELTLGHHVIMGRKTYESIGKPLPGRTNVIVTRQHDYKADGCRIVHSLDAAFMTSQQDPESFVIGGGDLFEQAMRFAEKIYLTQVETSVDDGDTWFPTIDRERWKLIERVECEADEKNHYRYAYLTYAKKP